MVFVAARDEGYVDVFHLPANASQPGLEFVQRLEHPDRKHVVRIVVDRKRARLWVARTDEVQIYIYSPGERFPSTTSIMMPGERIGDLALDADGNALVHTKDGAQIFRIDADTHARQKWLEPFPYMLNSASLATTRNRAVLTRDQRQIIFQSPLYGTLARIDLQSKNVEHLEMKPPLELTCGLLFWKYGTDVLQAIDCDGRWGAALTFHPGSSNVTSRFTSHPGAP